MGWSPVRRSPRYMFTSWGLKEQALVDFPALVEGLKLLRAGTRLPNRTGVAIHQEHHRAIS
jgi:hypothetical protein